MKMSVTEWCLGRELQPRSVGTSFIRANVLRNTIRFQDPVYPGTVYRVFDLENLPRSCSNSDEGRLMRVNLGRIRRFTPNILGVKPNISSLIESKTDLFTSISTTCSDVHI